MKNLLLFMVIIGLLVALPAIAADQNQDGIDDSIAGSMAGPAMRDGELIAIVNTGDGTVTDLLNRLTALGYSPALIPIDSGYDVLSAYGLVCLPVAHGSLNHNANFANLATDYHAYVEAGGGLWIGQPNPYQMPNHTTEVSWAPYELTVEFAYSLADCPSSILAEHCITTGLVADDMPFPGDNAISYGSEWEVLVAGPNTGRPAVMFALYGAGQVLVEFGHPGTGAICSPSDECLDRFVTCIIGGTVMTESSSWGGVKSIYR